MFSLSLDQMISQILVPQILKGGWGGDKKSKRKLILDERKARLTGNTQEQTKLRIKFC